MRYGDYELRRGDRDSTFRYAGSVRSAAAGDIVPTAGVTPFIEQLQQDLRELGFPIVGSADGLFGRRTEWAIREFQIYAKMPNVARAAGAGVTVRYADGLEQQPNASPYRGPISGIANADTRFLLQSWLDHQWRCPVVIEAWTMRAGDRDELNAENIWLHDELTSTTPRVFATDFTGYYAAPGLPPADAPAVLGEFADALDTGPRSIPPRHTWPDAEILPENLVGKRLARLNAVERSTFKVIRSVAEVECIGFFDCINAYDNAVVSLGPCHWTLALGTGATRTGGELAGFLAYLRHADPAAFSSALGFFGLSTEEGWDATGVPNGGNLAAARQRKYIGRLALQQQDGSFAPLANSIDEVNYLRTWHWFYRFVMAGRTVAGFQRRQWHMARVRVRDLLAATWPASAAIPSVASGAGTSRPATIGDVFTSERAVALLLRWHIRFPGHVIRSGRAGSRLANVLRRAGTLPGDLSSWNDAQEAALLEAIMSEVAAVGNIGLESSMKSVRDWPTWGRRSNPRGFRLDVGIGKLDVARGSFQFDTSDLPPSPF